MFRRANLILDAIPDWVVDEAVESGLLVGRLGLTDAEGNPRCAAVRPPVIDWLARLRGDRGGGGGKWSGAGHHSVRCGW
jgi:Family of unknown function (DUF5990)